MNVHKEEFDFQFIILISLINKVIAQNTGSSPVDHLLNSPFYIPTIRWESYEYVNDAEINTIAPGRFQQFLIKNKNELLVHFDGTGILYKVDGYNGSKISFHRLDSTFYFGYNFGAFTFSYKDTIYSFGGYGFWKTNGLLRAFIENKKEWELIKLNAEIPHQSGNVFDLIWYEQSQGKVYFGFTRQEENNLKHQQNQSIYDYRVVMLDLEKREIFRIGNLSGYLRSMIPGLISLTSTQYGQFVYVNGKYFFLNYSSNQIKQLSRLKEQKINQSPAVTFLPTFYSRIHLFSLEIHKKSYWIQSLSALMI